MHARTVTFQVQPGKMEEAIRIYRDVVSGAPQKGFKGAYLLTDGNSGKSISVTLWETEADMLATETSGWWRQQIDKFAPVTAGAPLREHYEVGVQVPAPVETLQR